MDANIVVVGGRLCAPPEIRIEGADEVCTRYLVSTSQERPHGRLEVIPVMHWGEAEGEEAIPGRQLWVTAALQRRRLAHPVRSRLEVVAHRVVVRPDDEGTPFAIPAGDT